MQESVRDKLQSHIDTAATTAECRKPPENIVTDTAAAASCLLLHCMFAYNLHCSLQKYLFSLGVHVKNIDLSLGGFLI